MKFIDIHSPHPWHATPGDDHASLAPQPYRLLNLTQWQALRAQWPTGLPVGLALANDCDVETLGDDLHRFALVTLAFPKWTDGRAYSQARLLRSRYRFCGEVRATGEVLVDMLPTQYKCLL